MSESSSPIEILSSDDSSSEEEELEGDEDDEFSDNSSDSDYNEEEEDDDDGEFVNEKDPEADDSGSNEAEQAVGDDEARCKKVIQLLQGGRNMNVLKLQECKAYLRKHGLLRSGTKATCIKRIQEHWSIKDGQGFNLYPISSFFIHCTGDVCSGDVVLFRQRVYETFDVTERGRGANPIGRRTVAGRVVKESYGAQKQQHTFTVEVLWSTGVKKLPPLFPLLVKGRNLYRLKTYRQLWADEAKRKEILDEKHRRGGAARRVRAVAKAQVANCSKNKRKCVDSEMPSKRLKKDNFDVSTNSKQMNSSKLQRAAPLRDLNPCGNAEQILYPRVPLAPVYHHHNQGEHHLPYDRRFLNYDYEAGYPNRYSAAADLHMQSLMHAPYTQGFSFARSGPPPIQDIPRDPSIRGYQETYAGSKQPYFTAQAPAVVPGYNGRNLSCSTPGCHNLGSGHCVIFACFRCCKTGGRRCNRHQTS